MLSIRSFLYCYIQPSPVGADRSSPHPLRTTGTTLMRSCTYKYKRKKIKFKKKIFSYLYTKALNTSESVKSMLQYIV